MASARRVLVVDDSVPMRRSLIYALTRHGGFHCEEASDGAEALKKLTEAAFDVVISDVNMPVMDGLKLVESVRSNPQLARTPIIILTTDRNAEDKSRALALGANVYLTKPVQGPQVLDAVRKVLGLTG